MVMNQHALADLEVPALPDISITAELPDLLTYAVLNNPELKSIYHAYQSEVMAAGFQGALPDPVFSWGYYFNEIETRVGPQKQKLSVTQKLPWYGKRNLREELQLQKAEITKQTFEEKKLALCLNIRKAVSEYLYIEHQARVIKEHLDVLSHLELSIRGRYKMGKIPHASLSAIQIEIDTLKTFFVSVKEMRRPLAVRLNSLLNRPFSEKIPSIIRSDTDSYRECIESLIHSRIEENAELATLHAQVKKEALFLDLSRKNYFPDVMLGLSYIKTDRSGMSGIPEDGKDPFIGTVSMNLPIWPGKYRSKVNASKEQLLSSKEQLNNRRNLLEAEFELALFRFKDSQRKKGIYETNLIPKAKESLSVLLKGFSAGNSQFKDLVDGQKRLLELLLDYERIVADYTVHYAELLFICGKENC